MITVSKETENFIKCLECTQELYTSVWKSLELLYGGEQAYNIMQETFYEKYDALWTQIEQYLVESISHHIGVVNHKSI